MSRRVLTTYLAAAALAFAAVPMAAAAQEKGARPNSGGSSSGPAVERPSGGSSGGATSSSAGSSAPAGSSSSSSDSSVGGSSGARPMGSGGSGGYRGPARPEYRGENRAVQRGSSEPSAVQERRRVEGSTSGASAADDASPRRAVPAYARPRDGRPVTGTAVERFTRPGRADGYPYVYDPYYRYYNRYPYGYFSPGYGFGVGYFYDPWMWGYPMSGVYDPYFYGGGGYYGSGGYSSRGVRYGEVGNLRLKVKPAHAQVFVDGYFVGEVDSYDGVFQRLTVEAGARRIEIRAEGYEPVQFEVMVIPGETVTYKGDLKQIQ